MVSVPALDLDSYFARLGYAGPRDASLGVLQSLHGLHAAAIPFENLDLILGKVPSLDLAAVQAKLVASRRGGYCLEQNTLFAAVLRELGFQVTSLSARVQWMGFADAMAPRTHVLLRVDLAEGVHLADVGFGGLTLTAPLKAAPDVDQVVGNFTFRLASRQGGELQLRVKLPDGWTPMYRFGLTPDHPTDHELINWYVATHPSSPYRRTVMAAAIRGDRRCALHGTRLTTRWDAGPTERRELSPAELRAVLAAEFGIDAPKGLEHSLASDERFDRPLVS